MRLITVAVLITACQCSAAAASSEVATTARQLQGSSAPDNVSSRLMIHIPEKLVKEGGYDHREALFGMPAYGGKIVQNVYYADSDLCDPNVDTTKGVPSREIDPATSKMKPWPSPYILMVDRGGCTFVQKVRNAQRSGAAGVIIADSTCLCNDKECLAKSTITSCETQEPIMADDGSGADISVPSFLMFKHDADPVKEELKLNRPVQLEMAWSLPQPDGHVEYDLWTTPSDVVSKEFMRSFKTIAESLKDHAYFTPHMYIYDGVKSHCQGSSGENFCYTLCTNNGRYCATDPDNDLEKGISGADVVRESLRRLCIWSKYGTLDGIGRQWWDYVTVFSDRCASTEKYFRDPACIKDAYAAAKIDGKLVESCMEDSGGTEKDTKNSKLDMELDAQQQRGVVVIPTAFVNTAAIRGALNVNNVFSAICSGYMEGTIPDACKCASCPNPMTCVAKGNKCSGIAGGSGSDGGVSTSFFAVSMLMVVGLFAGLGAWHYQRTREDMREQVRGILAEYMPLEDHDMGGSSGAMNGSPMDFARGGATTSLIS